MRCLPDRWIDISREEWQVQKRGIQNDRHANISEKCFIGFIRTPTALLPISQREGGRGKGSEVNLSVVDGSVMVATTDNLSETLVDHGDTVPHPFPGLGPALYALPQVSAVCHVGMNRGESICVERALGARGERVGEVGLRKILFHWKLK